MVLFKFNVINYMPGTSCLVQPTNFHYNSFSSITIVGRFCAHGLHPLDIYVFRPQKIKVHVYELFIGGGALPKLPTVV